MPFTFVDAGAPDDPENRQKIRRHLSLFHALQRKERDAKRHRNSVNFKATAVVAAGPLPWMQKNADEDDLRQQRYERSLVDSSSISSYSASTLFTTTSLTTNESNLTLAPDVLLFPGNASPVDILGAARKDPFQTYPIKWDPELDTAVDFLVNDLGPLLHGYARNKSVDIIRDLSFVIATQDAAAFHAKMLLAFINIDLINGRTLPGMRALHHRIEAVRLVNERLAQPMKQLDESTLNTIISLACIEQAWRGIGRNEISHCGLEAVLAKCGGLKAIRRYPLLEHKLYGISLLTPNLVFVGTPDFYDEKYLSNSLRDQRRAATTELVELLHSAASRARSWPFSMISFAFQPGSPVYDLLVSPVSNEVSPNIQFSQNADERSQLSILLRFHAILARLPEQAEIIAIVRKLNLLIRDAWIWRNSLVMLQFLIVKKEYSSGIEDPDLSWHVLRMVEVSMNLSKEAYVNMKEFMFALLSQSGYFPRLDLMAIQRDLDKCC